MKRKLSDDELENVTGGMGDRDDKISGYSGFVSEWDVGDYVGKELYFSFLTGGGAIEWVKGRVVRSYEREIGCAATSRRHVIVVTDGSENWQGAIGGEREILGDNYNAYTTKY